MFKEPFVRCDQHLHNTYIAKAELGKYVSCATDLIILNRTGITWQRLLTYQGTSHPHVNLAKLKREVPSSVMFTYQDRCTFQ